jgi:hypothetical protein
MPSPAPDVMTDFKGDVDEHNSVGHRFDVKRLES